MMLRFPDLDVLRLALTTGLIPPAISQAPADAAFEDGAAWVRPAKGLARGALADLRKLGVEDRPDPIEPAFSACCWAQLLPLRRDPAAGPPDATTPVVFELAEVDVPCLVAEVLRLGNDRQGLRWLAGDGGGPPRALLRVVGPPYYSLLRALDRGAGGPCAFVERAPRLLVEVGYTHPLLDRIKPPPGRIVLMRAPRSWTVLPEGAFRDIYEVLEFRLPNAPLRWRDAQLAHRLAVPVRLARGNAAEAAELWVIRDDPGAQLDALVRGADSKLLARLAFAVGTHDGRTRVVLRARPSKLPPPVLVLEGTAFRPYQRLLNLFLPVGTRLHPPLRRDAVAKLLAADPTLVTWLDPREDGRFVPEGLPDDAFRPLDQWVDYVLDNDRQALDAWVQSARFDFESFACRDDDAGPGKGPPRESRRRKGRKDEEAPEPAVEEAEEFVPFQRPKEPAGPKVAAEIEPLAPAEPDAARVRLGELEGQFLGLDTPLDDPDRRGLWREMAGLNAGLGRAGDATACWAHALWEADDPPAAWLRAWAEAEAKASGRPIADGADLDRLLADPKPAPADLRVLASALAAAGAAMPDLPPRLGRVQNLLERLESILPVRVAWLAWVAVVKLSGGDVLAQARARDRALERLHHQGLSPDLDLPGFLRFRGDASGTRARLVRDQLIELNPAARAWAERGRIVSGHTLALADLMFAFGHARLGDADESDRLLRSGLGGLKATDPVLKLLGRAFEHRIRQALEGKAGAGPLPDDLMATLDRMGKEGGDAQRKQEKTERYVVDRLREHSRILEPHEKIDPYRHWYGPSRDGLSRELAELVDLQDRAALAGRVTRLLAERRSGPKAAEQVAAVLGAALDVAFRLGEAFARGLLDRVPPAVGRLEDLSRQAVLLEKGIHLAAHFDRATHVQAFVGRFAGLLAEARGADAIRALEPLMGQCFRGLRSLGMRDEIDRLLDGMAALVLRERGVSAADPAGLASARGAGEPADWAQTLKLLLHVAAGWSYFGRADRAAPVLDEVRSLLMEGNLIPIHQTGLVCAYARALGHFPAEVALPRVADLFRHLERVHDTFTTNSHYSLSRLDLIEAVVLTLVSDDFTLDQAGRRWLDDDEYLVRRRIHRDVRAALGEGG